jgi:DNA-binding MarR family transcriptional regulator
MAKDTLLSSFTPSMMSAETLDKIFVQREALAHRLFENIRDSATTTTKNHALLIGPRGIGKTHLVSLLYHRIQADTELKERIRIAWLREESWDITTYTELIENILATLAKEYRDDDLKQRASLLKRLPDAEAGKEAERLLLEWLADRTLLLIAENFDDLFSSIGDDGQHKLRSFLETHNRAVLLTTATGLFNGVSLRTSPFYGFFNITHLREFTVKEAQEFLVRVAELREDADLAAFLRTEKAENRLKAVEALAGGSPRIWEELLDELVPLFLKMVDELTPYYQERMRHLSPQQRKIATYLCRQQGAIPVKKIAEDNRLKPNVVAAQLKEMDEKGYVRPATLSIPSKGDNRIAYYEMREPLMRLCLEVKENRAEPIRLIVDFLRLWYDQKERISNLIATPEITVIERMYLAETFQDHEDYMKYFSEYLKDNNAKIISSDMLTILSNISICWFLGSLELTTEMEDEIAENEIEIQRGKICSSLPLRLLRASIIWLKSRDRAVLMELPAEERAIMESIIKTIETPL